MPSVLHYWNTCEYFLKGSGRDFLHSVRITYHGDFQCRGPVGSTAFPCVRGLTWYTQVSDSSTKDLYSLSLHTSATSLYLDTPRLNFRRRAYITEAKDLTSTLVSQNIDSTWSDPSSSVFSDFSQIIVIGWYLGDGLDIILTYPSSRYHACDKEFQSGTNDTYRGREHEIQLP